MKRGTDAAAGNPKATVQSEADNRGTPVCNLNSPQREAHLQPATHFETTIRWPHKAGINRTKRVALVSAKHYRRPNVDTTAAKGSPAIPWTIIYMTGLSCSGVNRALEVLQSRTQQVSSRCQVPGTGACFVRV